MKSAHLLNDCPAVAENDFRLKWPRMTSIDHSHDHTLPPAVQAWLAGLATDIAARKRDHLWRRLPVVGNAVAPRMTIDSRSYLQFCTNNYLGLAADERVIDAARTAIGRYGLGAGASRLVAGSMESHHALEAALSAFKQTPATLLFSSGYTANLAVLTTFAGPGDRIVSDKLNHASLLDAAKYSGAEHRVFPHLNYRRAAASLAKPGRGKNAIIKADDISESADSAEASAGGHPDAEAKRFVVTDTVFSMDGDIADLPALCAAAGNTRTLIVLDEAHATGLLGPDGRGLAAMQQVESQIAATVGTLSKALGSVGGFVSGPAEVIETLVQKARGLIYTTAMPAACSAAAIAALNIAKSEPHRRLGVMAAAKRVKSALEMMGYNCGQSCTPIIPVILGRAETALAAAEWLKTRGIFVPAIRPPTVPPNSARLRISLMATHTDEDLDQLLRQMKSMRDEPFLNIVPIL